METFLIIFIRLYSEWTNYFEFLTIHVCVLKMCFFEDVYTLKIPLIAKTTSAQMRGNFHS